MIEIKNIEMQFNKKVILNDFNLQIEKGDFLGILGTNGVGKTTLLKIIMGMIVPNKGTIIINGEVQHITNYSLQNNMGFVPDHAILYEYLTGEEYLHFVGGMFKVSNERIKKFTETVLKDMGLIDVKDKLIKTYSHGMKQKVSIASSLIHEPKFLLLDEPLTGVDLISGKNIRNFLKQYTENGNTVIITTHLLELAHSICNKIAIIHKGKLAKIINVTDYDLEKLEKEVESIYV